MVVLLITQYLILHDLVRIEVTSVLHGVLDALGLFKGYKVFLEPVDSINVRVVVLIDGGCFSF